MKRGWRLAAAALIALAVVGCSDTGPQPAELVKFKPEVKAKVAWKASAGDSEPYLFTPALWEGDYFIAGTEGGVRRLDGRNGRRKWSVSLKDPLSGGVEAGDGFVFVGTARGEVLALDAATGKLKWRANAASEVLSAPVLSDSIVVVRSGDGRIAGFDVADGTRKWEYLPVNPPALIIRNPFRVRIVDGVVYAGLAGGRMVALRLSNGSLVWEAAVSQPKGETELERVTDVLSTPVVEGGQACAVSFQGRIACFDAARGALSWARNASSPGGLAASATAFFFVDETGSVHAVDRTSGASLWKLDQFSYRSPGAPAVVGRYVVVGDFEGYLHFLSQDDGRVVGRLSTDGSAISMAPMVVGENNLAAQTTEGHLYAVTVR